MQVIFKGAQVLAGHLPDNINGAPILLQYSEAGVQTGDTFKDALRYLHAAMRVRHNGDPNVCGLTIVVTTDGHASRYDYLVAVLCKELNIRLNIRAGATSWVTQMWDQIFHKFTEAYTYHAMIMVRSFNLLKENQFAEFKMHKKTVLGIICHMHRGGGCTWATPGLIVGAFEKVGIHWHGIEVKQLLAHPQISGAVKVDTRFKSKAQLPTPFDMVTPPPPAPTTPTHLRKGTSQWYKFKAEKNRKQLDFYTFTPETCFTAAVRIPTSSHACTLMLHASSLRSVFPPRSTSCHLAPSWLTLHLACHRCRNVVINCHLENRPIPPPLFAQRVTTLPIQSESLSTRKLAIS